MLVRSRAIVLGRVKYNDTSDICTLFTEQMGAVSFIVRIPKTRRAAVQTILLQPLTLLEVEWNQLESRHLHRLTSAVCIHPYSTLPYHPVKAALSQYLAELLYHALRQEHDGTRLYPYLDTSLRWLDEAPSGYANFYIVFLLYLARLLGIEPNLTDYRDGDCFDLQSGCFVASKPLHPYYIEGREARLVALLPRCNLETMRCFRFTRAERGRLLQLMGDYYRLHIPGFPQLKSVEVLREVFA